MAHVAVSHEKDQSAAAEGLSEDVIAAAADATTTHNVKVAQSNDESIMKECATAAEHNATSKGGENAGGESTNNEVGKAFENGGNSKEKDSGPFEKLEDAQAAAGHESVKEEEPGEKNAEAETRDHSASVVIESSGDSSKGDIDSDSLSDLKDYEKKALNDLRSRLEDAILMNKLFKHKKEPDNAQSTQEEPKNEEEEAIIQSQEAVEKETTAAVNQGEVKEEGKPANGETGDKGIPEYEDKEKEKTDEGNDATGKSHDITEEKSVEVDKNIALWGVPLLPSRGDKATDVILVKFLRSKEFEVNDSFEMLRNTLQWRKDNNMDSILDEDFGTDYESIAYMNGVDREGHPICYNIYGVLGDDEIYNRAFGTEKSREMFLRWRLQLMEKEIQKLEFKDGGVSSLLQINDLRNSPGPAKKDVRHATKKAVSLLQDNYPEFVATNIFINVPFWYYAFNAVLSPFLTQRTKSKFVFARPAKVTETLLKYIAAEEIPIHYGGLKRENDSEFSAKDPALEVVIKAGLSGTVEIPIPEGGSTLVWDLTVVGWEVNYKEEFVPTDEGSYTVIVKKGRKMGWQEGSVRNSFRSNEPGKLVITIENGTFKKKRVFYRYK